MSADLSGKVVVVTGSTRGIGRAIVDACAVAGAMVVVSSRTDEAVKAAVSELTATGAECWGMVADVSSAEDVERLFEAVVDRHRRIDVWINNAGISLGYKPFDEHTPEEIERIVAINVTGTMLACRLLIPYFTENPGILINMTGRGHKGEATPFTAAYASTKAAISSLTKSLAAENVNAPISIHALLPGMVATDFYTDIEISPRLEAAKDNWRYALDAFGVSLDDVGTRTAEILQQEPGRKTGETYSLLSGGATARGIVKMIYHRAAGHMGSEV